MPVKNVLEAVLILAEVATRFASLAQEYKALIDMAAAEGRDLTDEELETLKQRRKAAVEEFVNPSTPT